MHIEAIRAYCLNKAGVTEEMPFGPDTLVFRVMNKLFALYGLNNIPPRINLKCDPARALELREKYSQISPGWHMNKKHWNTVETENGLDDSLLTELIDHSYSLVVQSLTKKQRDTLSTL